MPENMNDTPATREQVERYENDPTDMHGKPYSTKQQISNAEQRGKICLYHSTEKPRVFDGIERDPDGHPLNAPEGWRDTPWTEAEKVALHSVNVPRGTSDYEEADGDANTIDALRIELDKLGVDYDKRWGVGRLNQLLTKAARKRA